MDKYYKKYFEEQRKNNANFELSQKKILFPAFIEDIPADRR